MVKTGGLFGKKRYVVPFFANCYGNDQTRGIFRGRIAEDNGEIIGKKVVAMASNKFVTPSDPYFATYIGKYVGLTWRNKTGGFSDGGISIFASTEESLSLVCKIYNDGKTYCYICGNHEDEGKVTRIFAVDYYNSEVCTIEVKKRKMTRFINSVKLEGSGLDPIKQASSHPCQVILAPGDVENRILVVDQGTDKILFFDYPTVEETGNIVGRFEDLGDAYALRPQEDLTFNVTPGAGPKRIIFNEDATIAYVMNELNSTVSVYKYQDYKLELIQTIDTYNKEEYDVENHLGDMLIFKGYLLVSNCGYDSVATFKIDPETGMLSKEDEADTGEDPSCMVVACDKYVIVGNQKSGTLESYELREFRGREVLESTGFSYMVNEPMQLTLFKTLMKDKK